MRAVIGIGIEEEDRKHTWMEDADSVSIIIKNHSDTLSVFIADDLLFLLIL